MSRLFEEALAVRGSRSYLIPENNPRNTLASEPLHAPNPLSRFEGGLRSVESRAEFVALPVARMVVSITGNPTRFSRLPAGRYFVRKVERSGKALGAFVADRQGSSYG